MCHLILVPRIQVTRISRAPYVPEHLIRLYESRVAVIPFYYSEEVGRRGKYLKSRAQNYKVKKYIILSIYKKV